MTLRCPLNFSPHAPRHHLPGYRRAPRNATHGLPPHDIPSRYFGDRPFVASRLLHSPNGAGQIRLHPPVLGDERHLPIQGRGGNYAIERIPGGLQFNAAQKDPAIKRSQLETGVCPM